MKLARPWLPWVLLSGGLFASSTPAVPPPIPLDFQGQWTDSRNGCESPLRLEVGERSVTLRGGGDSQALTRLDLCYSCEGGAGYAGRSVWLMALDTDGRSQLVARFNTGEREGVTVVDLQDPALAQRYPLNGLNLRQCPDSVVLPHAAGQRP
ncbi:hypothetical protein [Methyloterricola oryzae]|uniref:hypothetical protein n=1 Tax=Methyloterricola oryzae TaxID=1495050 RepID=UPI0005EB6DD3|nr:hypothetical protein [Methyloterricola oryzae]